MIVPVLRKFLTSGSDKKPVLVVLAGPNGAGKTTFHELFIAPSGLPFVNAYIIAKEHVERENPLPIMRQPGSPNKNDRSTFRKNVLSAWRRFFQTPPEARGRFSRMPRQKGMPSCWYLSD
jgi:hypothetical protein